LYDDPDNDICVLEVSGIAGEPAFAAAFYPDRGSRVYSVGAPLGLWDKDVVNLVEGFYIGVLSKPLKGDNGKFDKFVQWSMPIVQGMSGSSVFYKGRIIGLVSHSHGRFNNVGWGPGLEQVRLASETALAKWRDSL